MSYKLNFANGNVQEYKSFGELNNAVNAMGGTTKQISGDTFVFVPKK